MILYPHLNLSKTSLITNLIFQCRNGDQIFVANQDTTFSSDLIKGGQPKKVEESKKSDDTEMIDTTTKGKPTQHQSPGKNHGSPDLKRNKSKPLTEEEVKKHHCNHGPNAKCVNCLGVTKESAQTIKPTCKHGPNEKCPNCLADDKDALANVKHESFEHFLLEMKKKCKGKHLPEQKCQNCVPVSQFSYKVNYNCPNHKPYPEGMCNKCLPPAVVLKRQTFRHVDYVSFMNFQEMAGFVGYWQQNGCMEQRMAWLYGYYSEDPNYPEGVRVNVEAMYEPPQIGEINGVEALEDPMQGKIDMIAESLSLERVGWIFTSINHDQFLSSHEVRKIARFQQQHLVEHPEGYKVSKFVTVVVKPRGDGSETGLECYMVSDQCQALERDNIFGNTDSRKKMILREGGQNEMIPSVVKEGKTVKEFEPDFFIVSLAHGQPKSKKDYNIMKNYDFPVPNRLNKVPTQKDFREYLKRHKSEASQRRFACFPLLVYIADIMDIDTALTIGHLVSQEKPLEPTLVDLKMVSRGVHQLKNMRLYFCDFGGSSVGVRRFLKSDQLKEFIDKNEHLKLEVYMKRGHHPYVSSTYINGYVKDQPLKNMEEEEIFQEFVKFNNAFGRQALQHNKPKVYSSKKSIQGEWNNELFNKYPQHLLEEKKEIPYITVDPFPKKEILEKKKRPHIHTTFLRKKFPLPKGHEI